MTPPCRGLLASSDAHHSRRVWTATFGSLLLSPPTTMCDIRRPTTCISHVRASGLGMSSTARVIFLNNNTVNVLQGIQSSPAEPGTCSSRRDDIRIVLLLVNQEGSQIRVPPGRDPPTLSFSFRFFPLTRHPVSVNSNFPQYLLVESASHDVDLHVNFCSFCLPLKILRLATQPHGIDKLHGPGFVSTC